MSAELWPLAFAVTVTAEAAVAAVRLGPATPVSSAFPPLRASAACSGPLAELKIAEARKSGDAEGRREAKALAAGWTLAINAVTHPLFWLTAPAFASHAAWIAAAELTIVAFEFAALYFLLDLSGRALAPRRVLTTVALGNLASLALGLLLLVPTALANAPAPEHRTPPPLAQVGSPEFFLALLGLTAAALSGPLAVIFWSKRSARLRGKALWLRLGPAGLLWIYTLHVAVCLAYAGPYALVFLAPVVPLLLVLVLPFFAALHGFSARKGNT